MADPVDVRRVPSRRIAAPRTVASRIMAGLIGAVLLATAVALILLWPRGPAPGAAGSSQFVVTGPVDTARVRAVSPACGPAAPQADGTGSPTPACAVARVVLLTGPDRGQSVDVQVPGRSYRSGLAAGDHIEVSRIAPPTDPTLASGVRSTPNAASDGNTYVWADFARGQALTLLGILFAVLVVAVARLRGLAAIGGVATGFVAVVHFMLPALLRGENPVAVALAGSLAIMAVILYLAHGFSLKTSTALLGTVIALCLTAGLAAWSSGAAHLDGLGNENGYDLVALTGSNDLSGIVLCGIIVAGLGVLNDVTVTQASAVWEIRAQAPGIAFGELFRSGMRIGRDHLASTVYTITYAYAGAALPTLLLIDLYRLPLQRVLNSGDIAEEVARTLVGAVGLVLAVPITTAVAAALAVTTPDPP